MDKKINYLILILSMLIWVKGFSQNLDFFYGSTNKKDIIKNCGRVDGIAPNVDTLSINIEGNELFIVKQIRGWGIPRLTIYVFVKIIDEWQLECMRNTVTNSVKLEIDQDCRELVFKSFSDKTIMILPFETINGNFDILRCNGQK